MAGAVPLLLVALLTLGALALFVSGRMRADLVALLILVGVALTGLVTPEEAVSGFANPATITVLAMLALGAGLGATGVTGSLGRAITRVGATSPTLLLATLMLAAAGLSAFVNNTAVVVVLLPLAVKLAHGLRIPPSKLLIPLSFSAMFGGTATLIGTSTNLLVDSLARAQGLAPISMFEFTPLGLILIGTGLLYMLTVGQWLLPARRQEPLTEAYQLRDYLAEIAVEEKSGLVGRPLRDVDLERDYGVEVVEVFRGSRRLGRYGDVTIEAGDVLLVHGAVKPLMELAGENGLALRPEAQPDQALTSDDTVLVEAVVAPTSRLRGRTPRQAVFRRRYNLTILAIQRRGVSLRERLANTPLVVGDTLLLQGERRHVEELAADRDFLLLGEVEVAIPHREKRWVAVAIMAAVVALPALGVLPILVSALAGVAAMVLLGCLTMQEVYDGIDWSVIFLLAGVIPLGLAIERSGAARLVADGAVAAVGSLGPVALVAVFYLISSLLTEVISNNATAILLAPIAVATAGQLGLDPRPLLVTIAFAASASFMTPIGYQTNLLVLGPGGYRYTDYLRVGLPLNLLFWVLASLLIPVLWPLG